MALVFVFGIRLHRSVTYIDAACCYRPSTMVCRSVTLVNPAKMAEPMEMPFGSRTRVGSRKHVLDGVQIHMRRSNFQVERGVPL